MTGAYDLDARTSLPGAWGIINITGLTTTGQAVITAGLAVGVDGTGTGSQLRHGRVRVINRSTSGNVLFGPATATAIPGVAPATSADVMDTDSFADLIIGETGDLWIKASTGTVNATVLYL